MISLESHLRFDECRARDKQLTITPQNEKALAGLSNRSPKIQLQDFIRLPANPFGRDLQPRFSHRVTVKPLFGYGGDLLTKKMLRRSWTNL